MGRLGVVLDRGVGVSPAELAAVWAGDAQAGARGDRVVVVRLRGVPR